MMVRSGELGFVQVRYISRRFGWSTGAARQLLGMAYWEKGIDTFVYSTDTEAPRSFDTQANSLKKGSP
jgi:hypothetical protein